MIEYAKKIGKELKIIQVSDEKAPPKAKFCAIIAEGDLNKNQLAKLRKEIVDVIDDLVKKGYTNFVTLASNHTEVFIAEHIAYQKLFMIIWFWSCFFLIKTTKNLVVTIAKKLFYMLIMCIILEILKIIKRRKKNKKDMDSMII